MLFTKNPPTGVGSPLARGEMKIAPSGELTNGLGLFRRLQGKRQPAITFWSVGMSATMAAWRSAGSAFGCPVGRGM